MNPASLTRRRLLAVAGVAGGGGLVLPRLGGTEHDPAEPDSWNHPFADPGNTASSSRSGPSEAATVAWTRRVNQVQPYRHEGLALVEGRLLVPTHDSLLALSAADGDRLWRRELPQYDRRGHQQLDSAPRVHGTRCLLASMPELYALDIDSGNSRWRFKFDSSIDGVALLGNTVFATARLSSGHHLVALDARSGREQWRADGRWVPLAADVDGLVAQSFDDGRLAAFDPETGTQRWESGYTHSRVRRGASVAIAEGLVYSIDRDDLVGIDLNDGSVRWTVDLDDAGSSFLDGLAVDGRAFVARSDAGRVTAVDQSGAVAWSRELEGDGGGVSVDTDTVYVSRGTGVTALDRADGETRFSLDVPAESGYAWTPVVDDGALYGLAGETVYKVVEEGALGDDQEGADDE